MRLTVRASALCLGLAAAALYASGCAAPGRNVASGSQAGGAVTITLQAQTRKLTGRAWTNTDLEATRSIVERRGYLTTAGVTRVTAVPPDKIVLNARRMPTQSEIARLSAPNDLRFYFISELETGRGAALPRWSLAGSAASNEVLIDSQSGKPVTAADLDRAVFTRPPELTTQDFLSNFRAVIAPQGNSVLEFELKPDSAARFEVSTRQHLNKHVAIFLDRQLITAPVLRGPIPGRGVIEGLFTAPRAREIADLLNSGALPVPLIQVSNTPDQGQPPPR